MSDFVSIANSDRNREAFYQVEKLLIDVYWFNESYWRVVGSTIQLHYKQITEIYEELKLITDEV